MKSLESKITQAEEYRASNRSTNCVCPKCEKKHKLSLYWTGTLPARKFCRSCIQDIDHINYTFMFKK